MYEAIIKELNYFVQMNQGNVLKKFGANLKGIRESRKLSQEQLAEKAELSAIMISSLEQGRRAPSFVSLCRLSKTLNTPISVFFKGI